MWGRRSSYRLNKASYSLNQSKFDPRHLGTVAAIGLRYFPRIHSCYQGAVVTCCTKRSVRINDYSIESLDSIFPHIRVGNGLNSNATLKARSCVVVNPPFNMFLVPDGCMWAKGKATKAAFFLDQIVANATDGTRILAILPEVLRTGTRYEKWRQHIVAGASVDKLIVHGQFDAQTDIDVFIALLTVKQDNQHKRRQWWRAPHKISQGVVGDYFEVNVGPVVPHRDPQNGLFYPFIHSRLMPAWGTVTAAEEHRRYQGTVFMPPFVVVRRTSRPGDEYRAIGTIIRGDKPFAIENHLIVFQPKDRTLRSRRQLLNVLQNPNTTEWLNRRLRCRHLTVTALKQLPWWSD